MKTAEEWADEVNKILPMLMEPIAISTVVNLCRQIQLDAFRAGMTEAARVAKEQVIILHSETPAADTKQNNDMTPEAQRIAIAEACGWRTIASHSLHGTPPLRDIRYHSELIPNYLHDLNAMHEAEKVLSTEQREQYSLEIISFDTKSSGYDDWTFIHATAAQRAEAFLRTIGKWKD